MYNKMNKLNKGMFKNNVAIYSFKINSQAMLHLKIY